MTLKTSSNSINPTLNMGVFTFRKNIGLLITSIVATLMLCPGFFLVRLSDYYESEISNHGIDLIIVLATLLTIGTGFISVVYNILNFMFLYSKKSSDVFHSLPMTRSELLISRWVAGVVLSIIPAIVGYTALALIFICIPEIGGSIGAVYGCLAYTVMTVLVCSSLSMIFVVCAGSTFDLVLSFAGVNIGLLTAGLVIITLMEELLIGAFNNVNTDIYEYLSPIWYCAAKLSDYIDFSCKFATSQIWFFVRTVIYTAVFIGTSLLLYNRRKAERAGDAYAWRAVYIICSFIVGITVSYIIGYMFTGDEYLSPFFWVFALLGSVIFAVLFGAVTDRGFKGFKRSMLVGASSTIALGLVTVIFATGAFGYSTRIPKENSIKSIVIDYSGEDILYNDPSLAITVHKEIVKNIDLVSPNGYYTQDNHFIGFTYNLKNGETLKRNFVIPVKDFKDLLFTVYSSDERLNSIKEAFLYAKPKTVTFECNRKFLTGEYDKDSDENGGWLNVSVTPTEYMQVFEAYRKDVANADNSIINFDDNEKLHFSWENESKYVYDYYYFAVDETFENTLSYLRSLNLIEREFAENEAFEK